MRIRLEPRRLAECGKLTGIMVAAWGWLLLLISMLMDIGEWITK